MDKNQDYVNNINMLEGIIDELYQEIKYNQVHNLPTDKLQRSMDEYREKLAMLKAGITRDMNDEILDYKEFASGSNIGKIIEEAIHLSTLTHCMKYGVGSVVFDDDYFVLGKGYNHVTKGMEPCLVQGNCYRIENYGSDSNKNRYRYNRSIHSEQDAILNVMKNGLWEDGLNILVTAHPCMHCAKIIAESGIKKVFYLAPIIKEKEAFMIFKHAGIEVIMIENAPWSIAKNDY